LEKAKEEEIKKKQEEVKKPEAPKPEPPKPEPKKPETPMVFEPLEDEEEEGVVGSIPEEKDEEILDPEGIEEVKAEEMELKAAE